MALCPAIVSVPVRALPVLPAMLIATAPLPLPLVPEVIAIHDVFEVAPHWHPFDVDTATGVPAPPAALMF